MALNDLKKREKIEAERKKVIEELQKTIDEVKTLRGFLPICSHCKSIRDENGYWKQLEEYLTHHSEAELTHSLCEQCAKVHYPEYFESKTKGKK